MPNTHTHIYSHIYTVIVTFTFTCTYIHIDSHLCKRHKVKSQKMDRKKNKKRNRNWVDCIKFILASQYSFYLFIGFILIFISIVFLNAIHSLFVFFCINFSFYLYFIVSVDVIAFINTIILRSVIQFVKCRHLNKVFFCFFGKWNIISGLICFGMYKVWNWLSFEEYREAKDKFFFTIF